MLLSAGAPGDDEPRVLEHAQMLHHSEAGHLDALLQLPERPAVVLEEPVEQMPPGRIGQRLEDSVIVHRRNLM